MLLATHITCLHSLRNYSLTLLVFVLFFPYLTAVSSGSGYPSQNHILRILAILILVRLVLIILVLLILESFS